MVRQPNGFAPRRSRANLRGGGLIGRGRVMRGAGFSGRGGIHKPLPLMSRPMPPPNDMRYSLHGPGGPPSRPMLSMMAEFRRMGPPRMPPPPPLPGPPPSRGPPNLRMGPRSRGPRHPLRGMLPSPRLRGHSGLLPPPMLIPGPPGPGMFRHRPPMPPGMINSMGMRGRGIPPGRMLRSGIRGRGGHMNSGPTLNNRKGGKPGRGRGSKSTSSSPSGELNKPWVTEAMKNEILKKHKLHQKAKKARTKEDWEIFKEHRNKVTTMLREAKLEYIGAHPEEDVEKILAEATNQVSDKDEQKESSANREVIDDTAPQVGEEEFPQGAEPMEEGGGTHESQQVPNPDPEIEMNQESLTHTQAQTTDQ